MSKELTDAEVKVLTELSYKKSIKKGNKMSKELKALEEIKTKYQNDNGLLRRLDIIETALKRLEEIDKLPKIDFYTTSKIELNNELDKKLKALEIIRTKQVNIGAFYVFDNLEQYNHYCDMVGGCKKLTQEEYNLLKEVLL